MLFITMPILFNVERNNLITQCIMIKFKVFVVWPDGDSNWFTLCYHSCDEFVEFICKHYKDVSVWTRVVAFQDKEIPNHQVLEYLGDFYRLGNEVQFVKPIEQ